jgi:hypothetical protein
MDGIGALLHERKGIIYIEKIVPVSAILVRPNFTQESG